MTSMDGKITKKQKYWYSFHEYYCPLCGDGEKHRVREYGEKPKDPKLIYFSYEFYDWCNE